MRRKTKKKRYLLLYVLILIVVLSVCGIYVLTQYSNSEVKDGSDDSDSFSNESAVEDDGSIEHDAPTESDGEASGNEQIDMLVAGMTLEEKIYQLMFVTPEAITGAEQVTYAGKQTEDALNKYPVGGIIYFSQNIKSREQVMQMITDTQSFSKIPLFVGVDEEGGRVSRLGNSGIGVTKQPAMKIIGDSGDTAKAYDTGVTLGSELNQLGFNVDFAPVADVIINSDNQEIGDRSFGSDPQKVSEMVSELVKGLEENNVSAVLKHFPGHGSTYTDSHTGYSESTRTIEQFRANEFLPFKSGIDSGASFVMVSHMTPVNIVEEKLPASLSKEIITDYLKNELGFTGIVITDSLSMGAITDNYTTEEAAVMAIEAGADMILMPQSLRKAYNGISQAVAEGKISEERIDESVRKILTVKMKKNAK